MVPSTLLGQLTIVSGEEDILVSLQSSIPYVEVVEELLETVSSVGDCEQCLCGLFFDITRFV